MGSDTQSDDNHPEPTSVLRPAEATYWSLDLVASGARALGIDLDEPALARLGLYAAEIVAWNNRVNLTSIVDPRELQIKHFLDSMTLVPSLPTAPATGSLTLLDVGSGAGLPGIALAVVRPDLQVTLLEATQKKCRFLEHVCERLVLSNVDVVCGRAEDVAHQAEHRETYHIVVARAVAPLDVLVELCLPFAQVGGQFVAMKKAGIDDEVGAAGPAIRRLGGRLARRIPVQVPYLDEPRQLIVVKKVAATPRPYPRRPGLPAKDPLRAAPRPLRRR
jgi:16S rRNA (guanine527-N7)-methyltransferase